MASNRKAQKKAHEITAQVERSRKNKNNRVSKARKIKEISAKNKTKYNDKAPWFVSAKLGNRLRRLNKKVLEVGPDRKSQIVDRINQIESLLK